ncbi:MAG TPA: ABC transporter permease [Gemmatimonadaceae bacterium]|nr:ABC transporter permease [Gemmatimonadaceae bacterium]
MTTPAGRARRLWRQARLSARLLGAHRLRTALSASGLIAGVATVMVMVALGRGAERRVVERVRALGTDLLVVTAAPAPRIAGRARQVATTTQLRPADAPAILEEVLRARAAAPAVHRTLVVRANGRNTTVAVTGTTPEGLRIRGISAARGRVHDDHEERERRRVAVIGPILAATLFGTDDPIGRDLRIGNVPFEVVGVARSRGVDPGGADLDNALAIPLETALRRVVNVPYVDALYVQGRGTAELEALEADVRAMLRARHRIRDGVPEAFNVQNQAVILRTERAAARALDQLTVGVAALAVVVGGIGILAVMLISVRERTREIGLRRALGARRSDIRTQFVTESVLLAVAGGVGGVALGVLITLAGAALASWSLVIPWSAAALSVAASALLGIGVGTVPATRAARLEPIAALRGI